ncbi:MAG: MXAN_2562 family outer membrane beta-barrel protein, partial [Myxococcota bacterium]
MSATTLLVLSVLPTQVYSNLPSDVPTQGVAFKAGPFVPGFANQGEAGRFYDLIFSEEVVEDGNTEFTNGSDKTQLIYTFDYDYYFFREFGLFGVNGSIGYWTVSGTTRVCPGAPDGSTCLPNVAEDNPQSVFNSERGTGVTRLTLLPMSVGVVYKFDLLKRTLQVPLVPYARGGISYTAWRSTGGGEVSERSGTNDDGDRVVEAEGTGGHWGLYGTLGLALNVDWLEP